MPAHILHPDSPLRADAGTGARGCQIVNARMVSDGEIREGSLLIVDGRIAGMDRPTPADAEVIDAQGAWLLPGMIDDQVHFREPGFEYKANIKPRNPAAADRRWHHQLYGDAQL